MVWIDATPQTYYFMQKKIAWVCETQRALCRLMLELINKFKHLRNSQVFAYLIEFILLWMFEVHYNCIFPIIFEISFGSQPIRKFA